MSVRFNLALFPKWLTYILGYNYFSSFSETAEELDQLDLVNTLFFFSPIIGQSLFRNWEWREIGHLALLWHSNG